MHQRNSVLLLLICVFYFINITINIFIEGVASIFPPAYLFIVLGMLLTIFIYKKVNPKITMYAIVSCVYIYFYFLLKDSPYLVNYIFMWLALPLSAIYQNSRVVVLAGIASTVLTYYAFFYLHDEVFPNVVKGDFAFLVLFGVLVTSLLLFFNYKINEANAKLQKLAYLDPLTGAANRLLLKEKFNFLKTTKINSIALIFIDMNGFKTINDTYGHEMGDQLLEEIAARLTSELRDTDLLCRLGGDEFVILFTNLDSEKLEIVKSRIQHTLEKPMYLNQQVINVSASIGSYFTTDISDAILETMLKEADRAMYRAKGSDLKYESGAVPLT
ncbi:GGDEF domain-containing protein [Ureibacillus manganicus]|uniref:GGDEF domain-containing protein n=1 Tax=Ureibacillus manganicus TaxID=1266064 RepID=UPI001F224A95|nr:GGDEF domain-containing protein [Ureibacillus manganicus]